MSARILTNKSLSIAEFQRTLEELPSEIMYQTVPASSTNSTEISWNQVSAPVPNALLDSTAYIAIPITIGFAAAHASANGALRVCSRQLDAVCNSIESMTFGCNGAIISLPIGDVINQISQNYVGKETAKAHFNTSGGAFEAFDMTADTLGVTSTNTTLAQGVLRSTFGLWKAGTVDPATSLVKVIDSGAANRLANWPNTNEDRGAGTDPRFSHNITLFFQVPIPPFNYYSGTKAKAPFNQMSNVIPHLHNGFQLQLRFKDTFASSADLMNVYTIAQTVVAGSVMTATTTPALQASLRLKWYIPPNYYKIPPVVALPIWEHRRFLMPAQVNVHNATTDFTSSYLNFNQMPDKLIICISNNRSDAAYRNNIAGAANIDLYKYHRDRYGPISQLQISLNSKSGVIHTGVSARELYKMTKENASEPDDYPYDFQQWFVNRCVIVLNQRQLANLGIQSGVAGSTSLQVTATSPALNTVWAQDNALTAIAAGPSQRLIITPMYFKRYLMMSANEAKVENQAIEPSVANAELMGKRGVGLGSGVRTGGGVRTAGGYKRRI